LWSTGAPIVAEVTAARLGAVEGVDAHELAELEEVGDAAGLLEVWLSRAPSPRIARFPELVAQRTAGR
jgi:hypothetical protein